MHRFISLFIFFSICVVHSANTIVLVMSHLNPLRAKQRIDIYFGMSIQPNYSRQRVNTILKTL